MKKINSINLEIIANSVNSIAEQMGVILSKTGYSTNIKERKDLSVAVFSAKGELLSLAQHIPLHFSSLSGAVEVLTEKYSVEDVYEGDIFIANDPYCGGGSHLPDIVLLKPVFYQGELIAYMVNTGHHADKTRKGSTIYDEGLRIPVIKLYEKGELKQDVFDLIMLNFQMKYERQGDLSAQMITNQFGSDKLVELIDRIGIDTFHEFCQEWLKYGKRKAEVAIEALPDGEYTFEDYMDDDGAGNEDLKIVTKLTVKGKNITFDFSGTCPQVSGPYNCVPCALKATVYYAMLSVLDHTIPANSGFFDSIEIKAEPEAWSGRPNRCRRRQRNDLAAYRRRHLRRFLQDGSEDGGRCRKRRHLFLLLLRKRQPNGSAVYLCRNHRRRIRRPVQQGRSRRHSGTHDQYLESPCRGIGNGISADGRTVCAP